MENTTASRHEQIFSQADHYVRTYGYYPNPEDPDPKPWPWPIGPVIREAHRNSLLTLIAHRHPVLWEIINGPGPQPWKYQYTAGPRPDPWLGAEAWRITFARNVAYAVIEKVELAAFISGNTNGGSGHSGGVRLLQALTDELCPPYFVKPHIPPKPKFDSLELFVMALEFRQAAKFTAEEALQKALLSAAEQLTEAGFKLDNDRL
ncbi:hypothetical protein [Chitinophaga solisilvae]|uniref:hypothetical protein n=1 Tax=Chitinophaga solisilvae TaxID=1233460 RepID=UPI00136BC3C0|nr:hypothetical protein [Chitinophaga solisilvae]